MKKKYLWFGFALIVISCVVFAKDKRARSYDSFYDLLARSPYSVVLFYNKSKDAMRDKQAREQIKELEIMFRSISKDPEYKDADLLFVRTDIARKDLGAVARGLHISALPTVQLFVGRQPINGARIQATIERQHIDDLIDRFLRKKIDAYLKEKDAARKRELERARIRAYNRASWGPYWYGGWGSPYWGGYYRPYYGGFYYGW